MYLRFLVLFAALALIAADGAVATSSSKEEQVLKAATTRRFRDDRLYDDSLHQATTDTTEERLSLKSVPNFLSKLFSRLFSKFRNPTPSSSSEKATAELARHGVDEKKVAAELARHGVDEKKVAAELARHAVDEKKAMGGVIGHAVDEEKVADDVIRHGVDGEKVADDVMSQAVNKILVGILKDTKVKEAKTKVKEAKTVRFDLKRNTVQEPDSVKEGTSLRSLFQEEGKN